MAHGPYEITKKVINNITRPVIFNIKEFNDWVHQLCKYVLMQSVTQDVRNKNSEVGLLSEINLKGDSLQVNSKWSERLQAYVIDTTSILYNCEVNIHEKNSLMFIRNSSDNSGIALNDILNLINTKSLFLVVVVNNNGEISFAYKTSDDVNLYKKVYRDMQCDISTVRGKIDLYEQIKQTPSTYGIEIGHSGEEKGRHLAKLELVHNECISLEEYEQSLENDGLAYISSLLIPYCSAISTNVKVGTDFSSVYATEDNCLIEQAIARWCLLYDKEIPMEILQRLHKNYLELKDYV